VEGLLMKKVIWFLVTTAAAWGQGVEFIGLENTTQKWAEDHLERLPDGRIHYCAADLKKAGYADASVIVYIGDDRQMFTVVRVVEAERAAEVRQRVRPADDVAVPAQWTFETAVDVLSRSKAAADRAAAAKALRQFGDHDETWRALASALRDPEDRVSGEAGSTLQWLRMHAVRRVDWSASAEDIAAVLHGTNLFGFNELVRTLTATGVPPSMAGALLRDGGARLLLADLAAQHDSERDNAHALLVQLRGADLGVAPESWQAWLNTL
jgi:hypothetical protein